MEISLPHRVYELLLSGFIQNEALDLVTTHPDYPAGRPLVPGHPLGTVLAWLWKEDKTSVVTVVADLLAEARRRQPEAQQPFRVDDLADGIRFSLPPGFGKPGADELIGQLYDDLPAALGAKLNP